jgi:hypothetical protein
MPIEEFAKLKSIPKDKVIKMIRDGFYVGEIKNEKWYVSRDDIGENATLKAVSMTSQKKDNSGGEYISVEEFAEFKGITTEKAIAMIRDGFYQGQIIDDKWYVAHSEVSNTGETSSSTSGAFLLKLAQGDYGLPKTYWLFGVLGNLLFIFPTMLFAAAESMPLLFLTLIAHLAYSLIVAVGTWRASDKYLGPKAWAILAKIFVIVFILRLFVQLIYMKDLLNA